MTFSCSFLLISFAILRTSVCCSFKVTVEKVDADHSFIQSMGNMTDS